MGTICRKNFFTYQRLILLYYFHQKILERETTIFKSCNFFDQTCFLHLGNQVFALHIMLKYFYFFDITIYLYIKEA